MHHMNYGRLGLAALLAMYPCTAFAQNMEWLQDSTLPGFVGGPGCARQIAVGPNNVPWVLGCNSDSSGNQYIYYLKFTPCSGECFGGSYVWTYAGGAATELSVDAAGSVWAVTADGQIWTDNVTLPPSIAVPDGTWSSISSSENFGGAPVPGFGPGRLKGVVAMIFFDDFELVDTTQQFFSGRAPILVWGLGYDAPTNKRIFAFNADLGATAWAQVDAQDGAVATKIALFNTDSAATGLTQTPWVINSAGNIYSYSDDLSRFVPMPGGGALDITDHFVVAYPYIFQWNGAGAWMNAGTELSSKGTLVLHVAYASSMIVQGRTYGPSMLWGLDSLGNIFYASGGPIPR